MILKAAVLTLSLYPACLDAQALAPHSGWFYSAMSSVPCGVISVENGAYYAVPTTMCQLALQHMIQHRREYVLEKLGLLSDQCGKLVNHLVRSPYDGRRYYTER